MGTMAMGIGYAQYAPCSVHYYYLCFLCVSFDEMEMEANAFVCSVPRRWSGMQQKSVFYHLLCYYWVPHNASICVYEEIRCARVPVLVLKLQMASISLTEHWTSQVAAFNYSDNYTSSSTTYRVFEVEDVVPMQ